MPDYEIRTKMLRNFRDLTKACKMQGFFALTDGEMEQMRSLNKEQRFFNATLEDVEKMVWGAKL